MAYSVGDLICVNGTPVGHATDISPAGTVAVLTPDNDTLLISQPRADRALLLIERLT